MRRVDCAGGPSVSVSRNNRVCFLEGTIALVLNRPECAPLGRIARMMLGMAQLHIDA